MDLENMKFCQSCAMPMTEDMYGTNADGSKNEDYCMYCFKDGEFTDERTMEEMIEFCIPKTIEATGMSEEEVRAMYDEIFPQLKRWMK